MRFGPVSILLAIALVLSGCMSDGGSDGNDGTSGPTTGTEQADECPTTTASTTVPGFTVHGGQWGLELSGGPAICGKGTGSVQSLVQDHFTYTVVEVTVTMTMVAGEFGLTEETLEKGHAGSGIVLHFKDEQNFNIVRYSPREQGWHLFTMIDGNRQKRDEGSVTPPTTNPEYGTAVDLRVVSEGGHVTAYDGATKVIDYQLPEGASTSGQVGLFLRDAGMVVKFVDFESRDA